MVAKNLEVRNLGFLGGVGLILLAVVVIAGTDSSDIVENGGFEIQAAAQGGPYAWSTTQVQKTRDFVSFAWDDQIFHTGTRSVSISIQESHPGLLVDYNWNQAVDQFEKGETYELTGWIKARDLKSTAFIVVQCWDNAFEKMLGFATTQREYEVTGTTDWVQVKTTVSIPVETGRVMILAGIRGPDNRGGKVWFDDIRISPASHGFE
jgi:hypothetical protein